jgi:hypothetical protein
MPPLIYFSLAQSLYYKVEDAYSNQMALHRATMAKPNQTEPEDASPHQGDAEADFTWTNQTTLSKAATHTNLCAPEKASTN